LHQIDRLDLQRMAVTDASKPKKQTYQNDRLQQVLHCCGSLSTKKHRILRNATRRRFAVHTPA